MDSENLSSPISPGYITQSLKKNIEEDAIICLDVGDPTFWFYRNFICSRQKIFLSANMASMGFALPAALSAKLDFPEKQVICITGDGGLGMLVSDFTTEVRGGLNIKVVVFDDGKLKNVGRGQTASGYPEFGTKFPNPDFATFARICGGLGVRVDDSERFDAALKGAFESAEAAIVDILVDPSGVKPVI